MWGINSASGPSAQGFSPSTPALSHPSAPLGGFPGHPQILNTPVLFENFPVWESCSWSEKPGFPPSPHDS